MNNAGLVTQFIEKDLTNVSPGWINAGIYYFSEHMVKKITKFSRGSIEFDFLIPHYEKLQSFRVYQSSFIDIGTPESYQQAPSVLKEYIK
jgi:NDP-sugar pyrophosphorylase family protein